MNKVTGTLWMISCMAASVGCAVPTVDDEGFPAEVGQATAALSNCITLNRVQTAPNAFTDQLQCDGVLCDRTAFLCDRNISPNCAFPGAITSTLTRCENRPTNAVGPFLDLTILRPECQIQPSSRVDAGFRGVSKSRCETELGACWDNRTRDPKFPWCYEPIGKAPTCGGQAPSERVNAGFPGISGQDCVVTRGKCWSDVTPNVPFCFQHTQDAPNFPNSPANVPRPVF